MSYLSKFYLKVLVVFMCILSSQGSFAGADRLIETECKNKALILKLDTAFGEWSISSELNTNKQCSNVENRVKALALANNGKLKLKKSYYDRLVYTERNWVDCLSYSIDIYLITLDEMDNIKFFYEYETVASTADVYCKS